MLQGWNTRNRSYGRADDDLSLDRLLRLSGSRIRAKMMKCMDRLHVVWLSRIAHSACHHTQPIDDPLGVPKHGPLSAFMVCFGLSGIAISTQWFSAEAQPRMRDDRVKITAEPLVKLYWIHS
jgi:hypothetical protein